MGEWLLVVGLAATLAWTTLCLGGYMAKTMVVTSMAIFGLAALGGVLLVARRKEVALTFNWAVLLPVPFLLYALASVLWLAPAQWLAWREWLLWLQMWIVFALALHFGRTRRHAAVIVGTFVALGLAGTAMAIYQRWGDPAWIMLGRTQAAQFAGRSAGMFGIPNSLAALFELMVPGCLLLTLSRATTPATKVACGALLALFLFGLVLSVSRGGWISLTLALVAWPLLRGSDWRKSLGGAALVLALGAVGAGLLYRFSFIAHERMQPFLEGKFEASRPIIWKAALQIWRDHPWFGSGAASYNVLFDQYRPAGFTNEPDWAHNDYLNTLSDYGVAGFALWAAAAAILFRHGWRAMQRDGGPWKRGLFLGWLAFAIHLAVDFHTKLPALAFAAAIVVALLLGDEPELLRPWRRGWSRSVGLLLAAGAGLVAIGIAAPVYRAEGLRFDSRRTIDRQASTGRGDLKEIIPPAQANFEAAVKVNPANGQAWADLSYATVQSWHVTKGDLKALGRQAEADANRALVLCPINAEFWVRKAVALDMQARQKEGEECFGRALALAKNNGPWWFYYAYHLSVLPERKAEARRAVETCLALDPSISAAVALRRQLAASP
ncbi:MAG: O-Antigen ligase [Lacunisphaera sp.]|nr:O-Antigen ligase [Lacunisphaera sp.]